MDGNDATAAATDCAAATGMVGAISGTVGGDIDERTETPVLTSGTTRPSSAGDTPAAGPGPIITTVPITSAQTRTIREPQAARVASLRAVTPPPPIRTRSS